MRLIAVTHRKVTTMNGIVALKAFLIFAPIMSLGSAYSNKSNYAGDPLFESAHLYAQISLSLVAVTAALCWVAAYRISSEKARLSVTFTIWTLWIYGPILNVVLLLLIPTLLFRPFDVSPVLPALMGQTIRDVLIDGGFTWYLLRSKYVKVQYR